MRDWLIDRGIETVIFVVNFLNLLDLEEQQEVMQRARSIAEEFRASLPNNLSNLYRVDALPALKARLKEDWQAAYNSGIVAFESALQDILTILSEQIHLIRLPRVVAIAERVKQSLSDRIRPLQAELERFDRSRSAEILKLTQTADALKKSFQTGIEQLSDWLSPENLSDNYQSTAASALRENRFRDWEEGQFKKALVERKRSIEQCIHLAGNTFQKNQPERLYISFPADPEVDLPATPSTSSDPTARSVAIGTAIGWVLLGPVGGIVAGGLTHLANEGQNNSSRNCGTNTIARFLLLIVKLLKIISDVLAIALWSSYELIKNELKTFSVFNS
ncbi:MAG: hypothetical protein HC820_07245 [Hydrococcus sp. RM1_1_31]|nr:hypothetical protein [Hydrococcus sp. RM1_1_31]